MAATKLTPDLQAQIVAYVRAGAYAWVAAQACGISRNTFGNWMKWGKNGSEKYAAFYEAVSQAQCQARVIAENATFKDNPFAWLRYGPGRERPDEPGWTESKEVTGANAGPVGIVVKPIDYRAAIAPVAAGPDDDSNAPGPNQGS